MNDAAGNPTSDERWADLYLEGSDQHRGWFHSSLLTGAMLDGKPPYRALLTHGFTVDGHGRKMSKSLGNVIAPQEVFDKMGSEIIRLWAASTDYSGEMTISDEILKRVVESYRRIRNTLRFLLANISDFDPKINSLKTADLLEIDRYMLCLTAQVQSEILACYERYDFHNAVARIMTFCSEDLGGFYLDILKDRLYTQAPNSPMRRSAQTVLGHITQAMLRWMAPFLSFTAEEIWQILYPNQTGKETIFTELFEEIELPDEAPTLLSKWSTLRQFRQEVTKAIELEREVGKVGSSLQAEITILASEKDAHILQSLADDLKYMTITSSAQTKSALDIGAPLQVLVRASAHPKCTRCWHYRADVGLQAEHPHLCGRCFENVFGTGEKRHFA
jgi:isoleucyl-tRNA synthetase